MSAPIQQPELEQLERAVQQAMIQADPGDLKMLGYGEISCVVAHQTADGSFACKRLPPFDSEARLQAYRTCVADYLGQLERAGVRPVETAVQTCRSVEGGYVGYCVQPVLEADGLLPKILARCSTADAIELFSGLLGTVERCISPSLGLDSQISNWAVVKGELVYLDVSTPLMRDPNGAELLDTDLFLASLPWLLRGLVRRFLLGEILDKYYDLRATVVDMLGNLIKEGLDRYLDAFLDLANARVTPAISADEVMRYYRGDARLWGLLQLLRRMDRYWQRRVRRRIYPFLLPGKIERRV